jgi:hypothetical protein
MRFALFHILVIVAVLAANLAAITSHSQLFTHSVVVFTHLFVASSFAGLTLSNSRPFWIAYVSGTSMCTLLLATRSPSATALLTMVASSVDASRMLPNADQSTGYFPLLNLQHSLEALTPPIAGATSGIVSLLAFRSLHVMNEKA